MGAAAGMALVPRGAFGRATPHWQDWDGEVMGAMSSIKLLGPDAEKSSELVEACLKEVRRLEALFSLHDQDSAISRLNAQGSLDNPDANFVKLMQVSDQIHEKTEGAFDVSVQPLWHLYREHFSKNANADPKGPSRAGVEAALKLVDQDAIEIGLKHIRFLKPGMGVTLNGIAQGYITDRITELLCGNGIDRVLVDMGEFRGLGLNRRGEPWQVGLVNPRSEFHLAGFVELDNFALATSGAYGFEFDKAGRFHHIFDAKTGLSTARNLAVSVMAPSAALADGLSTAFSGMELKQISQVIASYPGAGAIVTDFDGRHIKIGQLPEMNLGS